MQLMYNIAQAYSLEAVELITSVCHQNARNSAQHTLQIQHCLVPEG